MRSGSRSLTRSSSRTASAQAAALVMARCSISGSATWRADAVQRVQRAHRLLEDHRDADRRAASASRPRRAAPDRGPRNAWRRKRRRRRAIAPSAPAPSSSCPSPIRRRRRGSRRPASEKETSCDDAPRAGGRGQIDGEVGRRRAACQPRALRRGSSASRRPSPSRLSPSTLSATARPGKTASRGATYIQPCASLSMRPQEACGGCAPSPR